MGKRSDGGAVGKVCRGCDIGIFGTFLLRGIGLQFYFSFQTPIRASELRRVERQFDLFVGVKGNVDAVQSRAASA
jgi:hypothetical protein